VISRLLSPTSRLRPNGPLHFGGNSAAGDTKNNAFRFWKSLTVTLSYAAISLPLTLALALFFAILTNTRVPGVTFFRTLFYLPTVIPAVVAATVFLKFLQDDGGWLNEYILTAIGVDGPDWLHDPQWAVPALTMISTWGIGTAMLMFLAGLQNIPTELYEAARVDGAGYFRRLRHITLPMLSPVLLYNLIIGLVGTFQYFAVAYTLAYSAVTNPYGNDYSMTFYNTDIYQTAYVDGYMGGASALAWILLVLVMAITLLVFKSSGRWVFYAGETRS
jgi:multiple sugar transport system permease protein